MVIVVKKYHSRNLGHLGCGCLNWRGNSCYDQKKTASGEAVNTEQERK